MNVNKFDIENFRSKLLDVICNKTNSEYEQRLEEYHQNIENDFQTEWSNKKFKWFFKKRRQKKLRYKIILRYEAPVFWFISDIIEETLPKAQETDDYFNQFVDIKDLSVLDKSDGYRHKLDLNTIKSEDQP